MKFIMTIAKWIGLTVIVALLGFFTIGVISYLGAI